MIRYIIQRLFMMIPVVLGVAVIIFTIMHFVPGDPAQQILGTEATQIELEAKRDELGLNDPFFVQLARYLYRMFIKFDFGTSYIFNTRVVDEIMLRFPITFKIAILSMVLKTIVGIPLGITAAVHQNGVIDRFCMIFALLGVSMPGFWVAMMLVLVFALHLGWLPAFGLGTIWHYILPVFSVSLVGIAVTARQMRSAMLEIIRSDFVTTARAKGLNERTILYKHALPNALIPVLTVMGTGFAIVMAGAIIIENVFSIPGMGMYLAKSITLRDYPPIQGIVVFLAIVLSLIMLLLDIAYASVDPRIKARYETHKKRHFRRNRHVK